jgi:Protein of unknown function (DUF1648).
MRKWLEGITLLALGLHTSVTILALFGNERLPERIPLHFDAMGRPDGWGSPAMLLLLPAVTLMIYLLFTVVSSFPGSFHFPVRVTILNRQRMQDLALDLMAWLKVEIVSLLTWMQWMTIELARDPSKTLPAMSAVGLVAVFATFSFYVVLMFRLGKEPQ